MGLNSVELLMAVEEKFGITISDEEACSISTVGDLHQCVVSKVNISDKSCLSHGLFIFCVVMRSANSGFSVVGSDPTPNWMLSFRSPVGHASSYVIKSLVSAGLALAFARSC